MMIEYDSKIFGLMARYSDPEEVGELKQQIVKYVRVQLQDINAEMQNFQVESQAPEANADGQQNVFDVSGSTACRGLCDPWRGADGIPRGHDAGDAQEEEDGATLGRPDCGRVE